MDESFGELSYCAARHNTRVESAVSQDNYELVTPTVSPVSFQEHGRESEAPMIKVVSQEEEESARYAKSTRGEKRKAEDDLSGFINRHYF